jgi:hypothetical protein
MNIDWQEGWVIPKGDTAKRKRWAGELLEELLQWEAQISTMDILMLAVYVRGYRMFHAPDELVHDMFDNLRLLLKLNLENATLGRFGGSDEYYPNSGYICTPAKISAVDVAKALGSGMNKRYFAWTQTIAISASDRLNKRSDTWRGVRIAALHRDAFRIYCDQPDDDKNISGAAKAAMAKYHPELIEAYGDRAKKLSTKDRNDVKKRKLSISSFIRRNLKPK